MLITPNHFLSVSYHKTNSRQCRDHFKSNVLETALFGRLEVPVTKQRSWVWIPLKPVWINCSIIWGKVHLSAKSDLVYFTACFLRPYLLRAGKHLVNALELKHKKIIQQLKQLQEKTNICVTFRTWSNFSVVISVFMRFFRNAARSTSKTSFLRAYVKRSVWRARSWEGAPKKTSSWRRSRARAKKRCKKLK